VSETTAGRSLAKGLLAGLVAGLVATAAKSCVEKFYPPRVHGEPEPPEALAEKIAGHALDQDTKAYASEAIHWGFGPQRGQRMARSLNIFQQRPIKRVPPLG